MKLFQQLLVAPAALGLLAPIAATAAEVNINDVANYASYETYEEEVSAAQFSDVVPGDWAYTALKNLSESYGCVDNAYTQNLNSGQALTRYEAASLINSCLQNGIASADTGSDAIRLSNEFGTEMAILKGRLDGLEYKVKELSAGQFSSATKMTGRAHFTTGFVDSGSSTTDAGGNTGNKLHQQYGFGLDLNTSFSGTDLLTVGIEAGNAAAPMMMDSAITSGTGNTLDVASLYYSFPVGDDFQITAGPLFDQDDVISATTSIYSDSFRLSSLPWGSVGVTGTGGAIAYANDSGFNASVSSVATLGSSATGGIWTKEGVDVTTISVGYDGDTYGGGLVYTDNDIDTSFGGGIYFMPDGFPTISISYDTLSDTDAVDSSNLLIGLDHPIGPGTASAAWQSVDTAGTTTSNYEFYYNYPVTDGISVQGGVFVEEAAAATTNDTVGYVVETFFSF